MDMDGSVDLTDKALNPQAKPNFCSAPHIFRHRRTVPAGPGPRQTDGLSEYVRPIQSIVSDN